MNTTPDALVAEQIDVLLSRLPGLRDAVEEDVHQARVATRRLRELISLTTVQSEASRRHARRVIRRTGRALGVVRELDTLIGLCDQLARLHPIGAGILAACRARFLDERERVSRRLVKRLERVDLHMLRDDLHLTRRRRLGEVRRWKRELAARIDVRASKLTSAIDHAGGVYFPRRLHKVRIQLKKLRYLVEIAEAAGAWQPAHLRRDAVKLQDTLGEIHDRQVLLDRLESFPDEGQLRTTLRADIAMRHRQYLDRRDRLHRMIDACQRFAYQTRHRGVRLVPGVAIAALMPVAGIVLLGRRAQADQHPPAQIA